MCGVKYSDAIAICAYDQTPLEPYDPAPAPISEEATNRKPVSRVGAPLINSDRQKVIKFGAIVFVIMGIIPPWKEVISTQGMRWQRAIGYDFIFAPPAVESPVGIRAFASVQIDFGRLAIGWLIVALVTGSRLLYLRLLPRSTSEEDAVVSSRKGTLGQELSDLKKAREIGAVTDLEYEAHRARLIGDSTRAAELERLLREYQRPQGR